MNRYIEIVYDDSSSMDEYILRKKKYHIAQELFEKEILPTIGLPGDEVVLRLLSSSCRKGCSSPIPMSNNRQEMLDQIKRVLHVKNTPLYYTVYDAIEACKKKSANEHLIFVLTDGDDNCGISEIDIIDKLDIKTYIKTFKFLLVQFAIDSTRSKNNLTALASSLGGSTISLDSYDSMDIMQSKLKKGLGVSGFSNSFPLEHCFNQLSGKGKTWQEINLMGIHEHQALLLFNKGLISWKPATVKLVDPMELAELNFVYSLMFRSGLPEDLIKTMLDQLKKPYYYSFDCIYWDFELARWRYFKSPNKVFHEYNPEARYQDNPELNYRAPFEENQLHYGDTNYIVEELADLDMFRLVRFKDYDNNKTNKRIKKLKDGDVVRFIKK